MQLPSFLSKREWSSVLTKQRLWCSLQVCQDLFSGIVGARLYIGFSGLSTWVHFLTVSTASISPLASFTGTCGVRGHSSGSNMESCSAACQRACCCACIMPVYRRLPPTVVRCGACAAFLMATAGGVG